MPSVRPERRVCSEGGNFARIPPSEHSGRRECSVDDDGGRHRASRRNISPAVGRGGVARRAGRARAAVAPTRRSRRNRLHQRRFDRPGQGGDDVDGSVLFAEYQHAGRGRHGRHWSAPPRAQVALSVGVRGSSVPRSGWGWLPLATGVAVADALTALSGGFDSGLKWPNDVLVNGGKLAGILAEVARRRR